MTHARLGVQTTIVLALIALVSWPETGHVRAVSVWRTNGPLVRPRATAGMATGEITRNGGRGEIGFGSVSYVGSTPGHEPNALRRLYEDRVERRHRREIPAAVLALGGKLNGILGRARDARNSPLPFARLLLRSLTTGLVEARAVADGSGEFVFLDVAPSGYLVELVGADGSVLAVSDAFAIDIGDVRLTSVRTSGVDALFGNVLSSTVGEAIAAGSRDDVTQVVAPARCVSPPCN